MNIGAVRATGSERLRELPGDALVAPRAMEATHAITIAAAPETVWPWLVQMGAGRAGWYSYDRIDNGGIPSARELLRGCGELAVGDVIPAFPGATDAFVVMDLEEARYLVLEVPAGSGWRMSWSFVLDQSDGGTRLITRARLGPATVTLPWVGEVRVPGPVTRLVGFPAHHLMQRKQLLEIRSRAEAAVDIEDAARPNAQIVPFPRSRRFIVDIGRATRSRRTISGFLEADVTEARRRLRDQETRTGRATSLTAYIAACVGRAVAADRQVHALRDVRGHLVEFDDVDINVSIEVQVEDRSFPMNHVVRAADKRSLADISDEIQRIKQSPDQSATVRLAKSGRWFLMLPAFLRVGAFRMLYRLPRRQKTLVGTVGLSAIGMYGRGGGWGTAFQVHPVDIVVGGIAVRPGFIDGEVGAREYLAITVSFDHDVVDGAPAARFASRLRELIEDPDLVLDEM